MTYFPDDSTLSILGLGAWKLNLHKKESIFKANTKLASTVLLRCNYFGVKLIRKRYRRCMVRFINLIVFVRMTILILGFVLTQQSVQESFKSILCNFNKFSKTLNKRLLSSNAIDFNNHNFINRLVTELDKLEIKIFSKRSNWTAQDNYSPTIKNKLRRILNKTKA